MQRLSLCVIITQIYPSSMLHCWAMEKVTDLKSYWQMFVDVWNFQIFSVENDPITLGKIIAGITLFVVGLYLCRKLTNHIERRFISKLHIDNSMQANLRSLTFYILVIFLTLFVLRLVNVPLTAFTVIGGALAIGVGFGSQNVVSNFISGLILMAERPIRTGDYIDLDGQQGTVMQIGARSTKLRSNSNQTVVVPNSVLLEKTLINWTLTEATVRGKVTIGVGYGSDVKKVKQLLLNAARDNRNILSSPEPFVWFQDFGDNALVFDVCYFFNLTESVGHAGVASEMRFRIEELFRESQIEIPFPQRDLHFHSKKPLQVQITSHADATKS